MYPKIIDTSEKTSTQHYIMYLVKRERMLAARLNVVRDTILWLLDQREEEKAHARL